MPRHDSGTPAIPTVRCRTCARSKTSPMYPVCALGRPDGSRTTSTVAFRFTFRSMSTFILDLDARVVERALAAEIGVRLRDQRVRRVAVARVLAPEALRQHAHALADLARDL